MTHRFPQWVKPNKICYWLRSGMPRLSLFFTWRTRLLQEPPWIISRRTIAARHRRRNLSDDMMPRSTFSSVRQSRRVSTARRLSTIFGFFGADENSRALRARLQVGEQAVQLLLACRLFRAGKFGFPLVLQAGLHPFIGHQQRCLGDVEREYRDRREGDSSASLTSSL